MKRKIKLSFEALERELPRVAVTQMLNTKGGQDPASWGNDCFLHAMRGLYKSMYGTLDAASYNQFNNNMISGIEHFENTIPNHTGNFPGYDAYPNTLSGIYNNGVRNSVGFATLNSMFDNVTPVTGFSELEPNSRGIINTGGHAVTLTGSYVGADGQTRYSIVDEQIPGNSKTYTQNEFYELFGGVHAIYTVGAQDWHNQAGSHSYSPTEYPTTYDPGEDSGTTTSAYDSTTTPYGGD